MTWQETIRTHYLDAWGGESKRCAFSKGPVSELPEGFHVLEFRPSDRRRMWSYATCGMSMPSDENRIELHIHCPNESRSVVELLYATAHFHRTSNRIGLGDSVYFGRPWLSGSLCSYGLVSLPYLDGPKLETMSLTDGSIKFYWVVPVTSEEIKFKKKFGVEALERRFDQADFDYLDPDRMSVV